MLKRIGCDVLSRFFKGAYLQRASSLVFPSLLAIVPLLIIALYVLSIFPWFTGAGQKLQAVIWHNFVANSASKVAQFVSQFLHQIHHFSWLNVMALFVVCVLLLFNVSRAFNQIWQVKKGRAWWVSLLIYLAIILVGPILIGVGFVVTTYVATFRLVEHVNHWPLIKTFVLYATPVVFTFLTFTLMNWVLPTCRVKLRYAALGGIVTAVLFELLKYGFTVYLTHATTYRALYGALAIVPFFILWVYLSWVLVLFGGLVAKAVACQSADTHAQSQHDRVGCGE